MPDAPNTPHNAKVTERYSLGSACCHLLVVPMVYSIRASLPPRDGVRELAGLRGTVQVEFNTTGIPLITAERAPDAFHALGFVTGGDRLSRWTCLGVEQPDGSLKFLAARRWTRITGTG